MSFRPTATTATTPGSGSASGGPRGPRLPPGRERVHGTGDGPPRPPPHGLFEEMKARIKETDMSVPTRRGPWWYYRAPRRARTTASTAGAPPAASRSCPRPASRARRSRSCWTRTRSPRARILRPRQCGGQPRPSLAGLFDRPPRQRAVRAAVPAVGRRPRRRAPNRCPRRATAWPGRPTPTMCSTSVWTRRSGPTGSGAIGWAPTRPATCSSSKSPIGGSRSGPARPGTPNSCSSACTAPTPPSGWRSPRPSPLAEPRVVLPRREGVEYAVDHLAAGAAGWFVALTNDDAQDFRVLAAPESAWARRDGGLARGRARTAPASGSRTSTPSRASWF